jgi:hypothetical protein
VAGDHQSRQKRAVKLQGTVAPDFIKGRNHGIQDALDPGRSAEKSLKIVNYMLGRQGNV